MYKEQIPDLFSAIFCKQLMVNFYCLYVGQFNKLSNWNGEAIGSVLIQLGADTPKFTQSGIKDDPFSTQIPTLAISWYTGSSWCTNFANSLWIAYE